ncbi:aquaporin [Cupriavidus sp. AU9028]|uniref:aquaporin n=1 Tax=Cupriavidus sp. AU9028 TaxID=2871157 RepID=UPI001C93B1C4|nr:aquaporin [Cupriavidus sp. AU9028]MBY4897775.1 aquaporin [Cupriavidus sp. AU9028]
MASLPRRLLAEAVGSFGLMFGTCGIVVLTGFTPDSAGELLCISTGAGLAVYAMTRTLGQVSGAHLNPAVTLGLAVAHRFPWRELLPYIVAQVMGALGGTVLLLLIAQGRPDFTLDTSRFAANGYGMYSPAGYDMHSAVAMEFATTAMLVLVTASVTRAGRLAAVGPFVLAASWTAAHLLTLPVTHAALNPARATGPALLLQDWALSQLWLFWFAPLSGGLLGGLMAFCLLDEDRLCGSHATGIFWIARWILGTSSRPGAPGGDQHSDQRG